MPRVPWVGMECRSGIEEEKSVDGSVCCVGVYLYG